ncbi:MAG: DUF4282 domain-containing protein [Stenotrophobium sp.]
MNKNDAESSEAEGETGISWSMLREEAIEVLRNLIDVRLHTIMTTRLAPAIYVFLSLGVVSVNVFLTAEAFEVSRTSGLCWLLLILPIGSIVGVITVRVVLESLLSLFRIVLYMETLMGQLQTLRGQTESIAQRVEDLPLPRIQFWRSRKRTEPEAADESTGRKDQKDQEKNTGSEHGASEK